jgi:ABC-2 type transport system permease protein
MGGLARYLRLFGALARYGLAREMAFRGNFLVKVAVEVLWLVLLVVFYKTLFGKTNSVAGWSEDQYLFFVGCYFALGGLIETFFLSNCSEFADLVRSGDLDFYLLRPIDEQFLVTCRYVDWPPAVNVLMGGGLMGYALYRLGWQFDPAQAGVFVLMFLSGLVIAYSFLLILTSTSVWMVRNQSLWELWWLFTSLMRYPREIWAGRLVSPLGWFFSFVLPVLLVINVPAEVMVKTMEPCTLAYTAAAAVLLAAVSRWFFRFSLRRYRSASS